MAVKRNRTEYGKQYNIRNREKISKYHKQYYLKNRERILIKTKEYNEKNKEKIAEQKKEYHKKVKEYHNIFMKNYYIANKEDCLRRSRRNYQKDKKNVRARHRKYLQTKEGKAADQRSKFKRRAVEKNIINTLTAKEWLNILEVYNYRCVYCGAEFEVENMPTKDHIIPLSKGGHNIKENIVPACKSCNSRKHNKILSLGAMDDSIKV